MIGVDLIGQIRRACFEQRRPIREIVRTLSVSRATARKVIRGQATEFKCDGIELFFRQIRATETEFGRIF